MVEYTVFRSIASAATALSRPVVTIGNFDGVHVGHQAILARARNLSAPRDRPSVGLTFSPHPVRYFRPGGPAFRLTTDPQKFDLLDQYGLDAAIALPFGEVAELSPADFVDQILADGLRACYVVVGQDFTFGHQAAGTSDDLRRLCAELGIDADIVEPVEHDGEPVSSTRIRRALGDGRLDDIVPLLGRPYRITGHVVHGDERGRKLGFPTANISPQNPLLPPHGVYATSLHVNGLPALHSVTNVGVRPTFGGDAVTVECFVLSHGADQFGGDLYGENVELDFWRFVRPERDFDTAEALVAQIKRDVRQVRQYFTL